MLGEDSAPEDDPSRADPERSLFRREALENLLSGQQRQGELLRISPDWIRWTYWILVAFFLLSLLFLLLGRVSEFAEGPAVVTIEGRIELTAMTAGTVTSVEVQTGQPVISGQPLVRFYVAQEDADLDRIRREFELQLVTT